MIGAEYTAPWGRYRVHREDGDQVVLADVRSSSAFVVVTRAKLGRDYEPAAPGAIDHRKPADRIETGAIPTAPSITPSWTPPLAKLDTPETLGAPIPRSSYHVPTASHTTGLYWLPCFRRLDGDRGEPHAWFVTEGAEFLCPACRGVDRVVEPAYAVPPPLEPAHNSAHISRDVLSEDDPTTHDDSDSPPPEAAHIPLERRCEDCGKRMGVGCFSGERGEVFCGACLELSPHLQEVLARHRDGAAPPPPPGKWKPRDEDSHQGNAKSEIGSFRRKPSEKPPVAPSTTAELWPGYTREVPR